jgi:hypothetical protein
MYVCLMLAAMGLWGCGTVRNRTSSNTAFNDFLFIAGCTALDKRISEMSAIAVPVEEGSKSGMSRMAFPNGLMGKIDGSGGKVTLRVEILGSHVSAEVSRKRPGHGNANAQATVGQGEGQWKIGGTVSQVPGIGTPDLKQTAGETGSYELKNFPCDDKWHDIAGVGVSGYVGPGLPSDFTESNATLMVRVTVVAP